MYKKYLYFICEEDGRFLVVKNGVVSSTTVPTALTNTPDGWSDLTLAWERDMKYLGLVRQLSLPFGFVTESAMILRKWFFQQSLERKLFLVIAKHEPTVNGGIYDHKYTKFYRGEIDPTSFKNGALKIEANVTEGGLHKLFTANKATQYEYPLSDGDATVKLDGINLEQTHNFLIPKSAYNKTHFLDVYYVDKEGEGAGVVNSTQQGGRIPANYDYATGIDYFLYTTEPTSLVFKGEIKFTAFKDGTYSLYLQRNAEGNLIQTLPVEAFKEYTIPVNITKNTLAGDKFYMYAVVNYPGNTLFPVQYKETKLSASFKSRYRTTYCRAYTPLALYKKLIKSIAGKEDYAFSSLLIQYNHLKLTSGDGLRGITGAKIKTSLDAFFDFCYVQMFAGMGIENELYQIKDRGDFLSIANPIPLGEVKNLEITEATDLLFNTVKVGYPVVQTDDVNGKYSFNNSFTFGTIITRVSKELNLVCPYIADPFAIELTRINLDGKTTTDDKSDNQVFILDAPNKTANKTFAAGQDFGINYITFSDRTHADYFTAGSKITITNAGAMDGTYTIIGVYELGVSDLMLSIVETVPVGLFTGTVGLSVSDLYRPTAMTITGLPDPATVFNIRLTPKRLLLKWMPWINSVLYREAGSKLTFLTTEKNADIVTVENGVTIAEKAPVTIGIQRLFINKDIIFETVVPTATPKDLEANPNRPFSFTWQGITYIGFIRKAGMAPTDEKEQTFKLLSAATNDFKYLIHG